MRCLKKYSMKFLKNYYGKTRIKTEHVMLYLTERKCIV